MWARGLRRSLWREGGLVRGFEEMEGEREGYRLFVFARGFLVRLLQRRFGLRDWCCPKWKLGFGRLGC